jgi:2-amino-4-hydroxy-6-hydroxymethyldihydropteridine diphosphokinase
MVEPDPRSATSRLPLAAWVALGSNQGDCIRLVSEAMDRLEDLSAEPVLRSSLWRTAPVDCPPGSPVFINAAVALQPQPGETPESLLEKLQGIERAFGRLEKKVLNETRPLDLDLLLFGMECRNSERLTLPHPRALGRRFVLAPLAEIAPGLRWPGQKATVQDLLERLPGDDLVELISL